MKLTIGTRGSALALWQANHIRDRLLGDAANGVNEVALRVIKTQGDRIQDRALALVGGKGLFVKEIEEALLEREVDLAVHSMKDVPGEIPPGLTIGCVPHRANPFDAWVTPAGGPAARVDDLDAGAIVGTSSLRRASQLLAKRPDLQILPIRGNVDTRLRKVDGREGGLQAIVLACAGLERMGLADRITHPFGPEEMVPAVGQGALAIEIRESDPRVAEVVSRLEDPDTRAATEAERAYLLLLEGNCQVPLGAYAVVDGENLAMEAFVGAPAGRRVVRHRGEGATGAPTALGRRIGEESLEMGGRAILDAQS